MYGSQDLPDKVWRRQPRFTWERGVPPASLYGDYLRKMYTGEPEMEVLTDVDVRSLVDDCVVRVVGVWGRPAK